MHRYIYRSKNIVQCTHYSYKSSVGLNMFLNRWDHKKSERWIFTFYKSITNNVYDQYNRNQYIFV